MTRSMSEIAGNPANVPTHTTDWQLLIVTAMISAHVFLIAWGSSRQSPTFNEPAQLVAGVSHLEFGRFDLYRENPPLVRTIAAAPVWIVGYKSDWSGFDDGPNSRPAFGMGEQFVRANSGNLQLLFTLARWACIPFTIIGALTCYQWTKQIAGRKAGLLACALWCGCPEIIGHGQLLTPDVPATAMCILAGYTFWQWLRSPTWTHTLISGVALGIGELTKTTLIVLYLIWPLVWITTRMRQKALLHRHGIAKEASMLVARMIIGIYIINLGYGFEGSFQQLNTFRFVSNMFTGRIETCDHAHPTNTSNTTCTNRFSGSWLGYLPVPLPKNYVAGIDIQQDDFENFGRPSYLRGTFREPGWWYYYLYGLVVKAPLALWGLVVVAGALRLRYSPFGNMIEAEYILLSVPVVILIVASAKCGFTHHMRYILPCFPFAFCWVGATLVASASAAKPLFLVKTVQHLSLLLTIWYWTASTMVFPHTLSYFNILGGGPFGGPRHLLGSNVDWGQDLLFLKEQLKHVSPGESIFVSYYGGSDPGHNGVLHWQPMKQRVAVDGSPLPLLPGYYAISVNLLYGDPWPARNGAGPDGRVHQEILNTLLQMERCGSAGYSIYIYHVPPILIKHNT
jgi:hypothetical protein